MNDINELKFLEDIELYVTDQRLVSQNLLQFSTERTLRDNFFLTLHIIEPKSRECCG